MKLKNIVKYGVLSFLGLVSTLVFAAGPDEYTADKKIANIQTVASTELAYVTNTDGNWGSPSCNAVYIQLDNSNGQYKTLLAMMMTAKAGDLNIAAFGNCSDDGVYFNAQQVILK